jgi:hypothetical protein
MGFLEEIVVYLKLCNDIQKLRLGSGLYAAKDHRELLDFRKMVDNSTETF